MVDVCCSLELGEVKIDIIKEMIVWVVFPTDENQEGCYIHIYLYESVGYNKKNRSSGRLTRRKELYL